MRYNIVQALKFMKLESLHLLKTLIENPRMTGAVWPSSNYLAQEIVKHISENEPRFIVELGPGTGVITDALVKKLKSPEKIVAVEFNSTFVKLLKKKFSSIRIVEGNAMELRDLLKEISPSAGIVVSSLPLLSLPRETRKKIIEEIYNLLEVGGKYIQFTYGYGNYDLSPFQKEIYRKRVWFNMPPARVEVYLK